MATQNPGGNTHDRRKQRRRGSTGNAQTTSTEIRRESEPMKKSKDHEQAAAEVRSVVVGFFMGAFFCVAAFLFLADTKALATNIICAGVFLISPAYPVWRFTSRRNGIRVTFVILVEGLLALSLWIIVPPMPYFNALDVDTSLSNNPGFQVGQNIAGIPWRRGSYLVTLRMVPAIKQATIKAVDLRLEFDANFAHVQQTSHIPGVLILPASPGFGISKAGFGSVDDSGRPTNMQEVPPDVMEGMNDYPAATFVYKQPELTIELPVRVDFVGGPEYDLATFSRRIRSNNATPKTLEITGTYEIEYLRKSYRVPVKKHIDLKLDDILSHFPGG